MARRHSHRSRIAVGVLAVLFSAAPIGASGPGPAAMPVILEIANATPESAVRCQLILAHFVTRDAARIDAGGTARVELVRMPPAGTLAVRRDTGNAMAVENVICGLDDDWSASRNDLGLARLRDGSRDYLQVTCGATDGLSCNIEESNH